MPSSEVKKHKKHRHGHHHRHKKHKKHKHHHKHKHKRKEEEIDIKIDEAALQQALLNIDKHMLEDVSDLSASSSAEEVKDEATGQICETTHATLNVDTDPTEEPCTNTKNESETSTTGDPSTSTVKDDERGVDGEENDIEDSVFESTELLVKSQNTNTSIQINIKTASVSETNAANTPLANQEVANEPAREALGEHEKHKSKKQKSKHRRDGSEDRHQSRKLRDRSRSQEKHHRSRSGDRSRSKDRHRVRDRSRSQERYHRSRDRHKLRDRSRRRYQSSNRSRSRDRNHSRDQSRSRRHHRSSRRSKSPYHRHSSHRSSRYRLRSRSSSKTKTPSPAPIPVMALGKNQKIAELTEFCRNLSELNDSDNTQEVEVKHPYVIPVAAETSVANKSNNWMTANQVVLEQNAVSDQRPILEKFPVSTGIEHSAMSSLMEMELEGQNQVEPPEDVSQLVVQRTAASQRLKSNPYDVEALNMLADIDNKMSVWCKGKIKIGPGKYTGARTLTPLSTEDHKQGFQSWARKNMFKGLAPVMSGFGMKMLMKMGWEMGKPLGRTGEGYVEPIPMDVKVDRGGLATDADKGPPVIPTQPSATPTGTTKNMPICLKGKHPISALQELCNKKHWDPPQYEIVKETGPSHKKVFLYKVTIKDGSFQPPNGCNNKKTAKAHAAMACLKALGLLE